MEDDKIIDLYWNRDEEAIRETAARYGPYCRTVAEHILSSREDVEECINDTWMRAWNSIPPQRPTHLRAFLAKITRNLSLDCVRTMGRAKRGGGELTLALEELEECIASPGGVEEDIQCKELEAVIHAFLSRLSPRDRDIFLRRFFYVEPVQEIAARYAMGENAVSASLTRTKRKLRAHLEKEGLT